MQFFITSHATWRRFFGNRAPLFQVLDAPALLATAQSSIQSLPTGNCGYVIQVCSPSKHGPK